MQVAKADGIYRCTGWGETHSAHLGEILPDCECPNGGVWEFLKRDNLREEDAVVVLLNQGILFGIVMDELPEIGMQFNIRTFQGLGVVSGLHRIVEIVQDFRFQGRSYIKIKVFRIGDIADELPIHESVLLTI